jgi:hypothetical protein
MMREPAANFDLVARPYRWMEYLSFGPLLQRCRTCRIGQLKECRRALVLGDGDGRFLAQLMKTNPRIEAEAVDASPAMLHLLEKRIVSVGARERLTLRCEDVRSFSPSGQYDMVATHFFLDCLSTSEIAALAERLKPNLSADAVWVVSDFAVPLGLPGIPARLIVSFLYAAFGLLTGLRIRTLPAHGDALRAAGFRLSDRKIWLGGLLFSELWQPEATDAERAISH